MLIDEAAQLGEVRVEIIHQPTSCRFGLGGVRERGQMASDLAGRVDDVLVWDVASAPFDSAPG